jgi:hypothetical protein
LIGSVEQIPVDESFVTLFPAYPRLSAAVAPTVPVVAVAAPEPTPFLAIGVFLAILVGVFGLTRRLRGRAGYGRDMSAGL